ncbi:MAG: type II toxin-antitoxin system HigB family toxin, partial [Proteobacteria bacterium]|nr:type II toxin-antitoxin system HigB family toxin [Pseudomonadota bacterium]
TDIRQMSGSASFLGDRRVVFNIKGRRYRLDVKVSYKSQVVHVIRIGTHAEYDKWKF